MKAKYRYGPIVQIPLILIGVYFFIHLHRKAHLLQFNQLLEGMLLSFDRHILSWAEGGQMLPLALAAIGIITLSLLALLVPLGAGLYVIKSMRLR